MTSTWEYAAGRISALENTLLPDRIWSQLFLAPGGDDVLRILSDTWYGRFMTSGNLEDALVRAVYGAEDELTELSPDPNLVRGILLRRDVRNARYIWKNMGSGGDGAVGVEADGILSSVLFVKAWADAAAGEDLPLEFREALECIRHEAQGDTRKIDLYMDRLAAAVERSHLVSLDGDLRLYPASRIELRNFLTAGRFAGEDPSRGKPEDWLLPGGFHEPEEVLEALRRNRLPEALAETRGFEASASALREALEGGSFLGYQRESDRVMLNLLERFAAKPFGPGLLASYVLSREMEAMHLNLIAAAKRSGMDTSKLQARLPR